MESPCLSKTQEPVLEITEYCFPNIYVWKEESSKAQKYSRDGINRAVLTTAQFFVSVFGKDKDGIGKKKFM